MNPELSKRVASIINYLAFNKMIPGGSRLEFAIRVDLADKFEDLSKEDQEAIVRAEREIDRKEFEYVEPEKQNARGKCPKDSYESGTFKCDPSLSDAAKSDEPKEFKELTSEYFSELGGFHVTKYQGMKEFIIRGHNKDDNKVVLDAISKLSKEDQGKMPDFTIMGIKEKSKYLPKLHTLGLQEGLNSNRQIS